MKKAIWFLFFVSAVCSGCGMEAVSIGACGSLGQLSRGNADCQCTAEDDGMHLGSSNQIDRSTHLEFCDLFYPDIDAASQYRCVDYQCVSAPCPEEMIASKDHLSCVPGKVACNPVSEIEDGSRCRCNEENGWVGKMGHCTCDASKHFVLGSDGQCRCDAKNHWIEGENGVCRCDASNGWSENGGSCACDAGRHLVMDSSGACVCDAAHGFYYDEPSHACMVRACGSGDFMFDGKCIKAGDEILFGRFPQTAADAAPEPIVWMVLESSPDDLFVLSKYALIPKAFNETLNENVTWENSTLRSWMNGYDASKNIDNKDFSMHDRDSFIRTAFTAEERARIKNVWIENKPRDDVNGRDSGNDTMDRVFLLSYEDVTSKYFFTDGERVLLGTPYDMAQGGFCYGPCVSLNGYDYCPTSWWIRTTGCCIDGISVISDVGGHGGVVRSDGHMEIADEGIRPALHIGY